MADRHQDLDNETNRADAAWGIAIGILAFLGLAALGIGITMILIRAL
jgi:hypothetical protein